MTRLQQLLVRLAPLLFLRRASRCRQRLRRRAPRRPPAARAARRPAQPQAPLEPAPARRRNPFDLLAWLFTPIFQTLFITSSCSTAHQGDLVPGQHRHRDHPADDPHQGRHDPDHRRQLVSTRQTQLLQPEIKEIQRKFKGDRVKQQAATQEFYKERGVNPAGGCLPALLTMGLLIPMYSVISQGLTNYDLTPMLQVFGINLAAPLGITCDPAPIFNAAGQVVNPCLNPIAFGINWGDPGAAHHRAHGPRLRHQHPGDHLVPAPARRVPPMLPRSTRGWRTTRTPRSSARWPSSCR